MGREAKNPMSHGVWTNLSPLQEFPLGCNWGMTVKKLCEKKAVWETFASTIHPETLLCINTGLWSSESTAPGSQCAFWHTHGYHHFVSFSLSEDFHVKCQLRVNGWMIHKGYKTMWNKSVSAALCWAYPLQNLYSCWPNILENLLGHRWKNSYMKCSQNASPNIHLFAEIVTKCIVFTWGWLG